MVSLPRKSDTLERDSLPWCSKEGGSKSTLLILCSLKGYLSWCSDTLWDAPYFSMLASKSALTSSFSPGRAVHIVDSTEVSSAVPSIWYLSRSLLGSGSRNIPVGALVMGLLATILVHGSCAPRAALSLKNSLQTMHLTCAPCKCVSRFVCVGNFILQNWHTIRS